MSNSDSDTSLPWTYRVEISCPGDLDRPWWNVANAGRCAQVAAALAELAHRLAREPAAAGARWCRYHCEIRDSIGVAAHHHSALLPARDVPIVLAAIAARLADPDRANPRR
ncbi:MAG: hypothetical protein JWN03_3219 [Nocardia sp.]|uniref:hypothetical protein n=1 Tax=Nocardia sp. TaxID=1821 RepID=UPI0026330453|nr:hypothetical protein [Nocardia sp.]MCU1642944.1 hypothetical protein [Nocardia sp.]